MPDESELENAEIQAQQSRQEVSSPTVIQKSGAKLEPPTNQLSKLVPDMTSIDELTPRERAMKFLQLSSSEAASSGDILVSEIDDLVLLLDHYADGTMVKNYFMRHFRMQSEFVHVDVFIDWWIELISNCQPAKVDSKFNDKIQNYFLDSQRWIQSCESLDEILWGAPESSLPAVKYRPKSSLYSSNTQKLSKMYNLLELFKVHIPYLETISVQWACDHEGTWNDAYQYYLDLAMDSAAVEQIVDEDASASMIDNHFSLFSLRGKFTAFAMECVKQIVDEMPLPDSMKTIRPMRIPTISDEVYAINGMIIRLIDDQRVSKKTMNQSEIMMNDIKRKTSAHDRSCAHWLETAIASAGPQSPLSALRIPVSEGKFKILMKFKLKLSISLVYFYSIRLLRFSFSSLCGYEDDRSTKFSAWTVLFRSCFR